MKQIKIKKAFKKYLLYKRKNLTNKV